MRKLRLRDLPDTASSHFLEGIIPGKYLCQGGMGFKKPGERTHTNDGPGGRDYHVHDDDYEVFVILQGKAIMEIDSVCYPLVTGDICVVEPGEDHHLISDPAEPCINLWLHGADQPHPANTPAPHREA